MFRTSSFTFNLNKNVVDFLLLRDTRIYYVEDATSNLSDPELNACAGFGFLLFTYCHLNKKCVL
jgi:hypothetical protein